MKSLNKITLEIRKRVKAIADELPKIPIIKDGKIVVHHSVDVVKGSDLKVKQVAGKDVDNDKRYIQHGHQVQYQDHEVNLLKGYQRYGEIVFEKYPEKVKEIHADIVNKLNTAKLVEK